MSTTTVELDLEPFRRELNGYCYRMLGSGSEAEDAVQETFLRAWRSADRFEGRSSLRSWLYRIATNICLDMLKTPQRRARPVDLGPASPADSPLDPGRPEEAWVHPVPDSFLEPLSGDPAEVAAARDGVRLAFVAALQHLPPKQRAVLILCEVLRWQAAEAAALLDTTVASVNSALQRARATLAGIDPDAASRRRLDADHRRLLEAYVAAFEAFDVERLTQLLHDDVVFSMPPYELWVQGPDQVGGFLQGTGSACEGSRLLPTSANGCPAFGSYKPAGPGRWEPWAIFVLEPSDGKLAAWTCFLYPDRFADFGLPPVLEAARA